MMILKINKEDRYPHHTHFFFHFRPNSIDISSPFFKTTALLRLPTSSKSSKLVENDNNEICLCIISCFVHNGMKKHEKHGRNTQINETVANASLSELTLLSVTVSLSSIEEPQVIM